MSAGRFSREALRARLGDEVFEQTVRAAADAPQPSTEQVERVRQIFSPHIRRRATQRTKQPASRQQAA